MSAPSSQSLKAEALQIWQAGVDAVRSDVLIRQHLRLEGDELVIGPQRVDLAGVKRIAVVGAGKAGAGMAAATEEVLAPLAGTTQLSGWVNVPADCVQPLGWIHLHAARPAGVNEPTAEGVAGSEEILRLVDTLEPDDLCLALISGGGSALLPAPVDGITLEDKQAVTRHLSGAGANIQQLNTVRKQLSRIKGGGLARACRARLFALIISDVIGDPLDVIASGPTVPDTSTAPDALAVLEKFGARAAGVPRGVFDYLEGQAAEPTPRPSEFPHVTNLVIGNNQVAVEAAGRVAELLGYRTTLRWATEPEGLADDLGRQLAAEALAQRGGERSALISGGEPVVKLAESSRRGRGGRNQQLVLAALHALIEHDPPGSLAILSGGTDGEDGPTDAAGAVIDTRTVARVREAGNPAELAEALTRNDAYTFLEGYDALIRTGPTHTNVMDLRVVLTDY